jgi:hypothetical protein
MALPVDADRQIRTAIQIVRQQNEATIKIENRIENLAGFSPEQHRDVLQFCNLSDAFGCHQLGFRSLKVASKLETKSK